VALTGPRLDRPSAIGDEGRARTVSLWIASFVVIAVTTAGGWAIGDPTLVLSLGTFVGPTVAGVGLANRDRFRSLFFGYVLLLVFGSLLGTTLPIVFFLSPYGLAIAGVAIAMIGIGLSWANVSAFDGLKNLLIGILVAYLSLLFTLCLFVVLFLVLFTGDLLVEVTTTGRSPGASLAWFLFATGYAAASVRLLLWQLPFEQFVAYDRRPVLRSRLRVVEIPTLAVAVAAPIVALVVVVATVYGLFGTLAAIAPPLVFLLDALSATVLLGALGTVGTGCTLLSVAVVTARLATRQFDTTTAKAVAGVGAGACVAVLVVVTFCIVLLVPFLSTLLFALLALVATTVSPMVFLGFLPVGLLAIAIGLIPDRAGGPAIAATGLLLATVGFGGAPAPIVFACAAASVVVWDVSAYGLGITGELGHLPETRRLELFHGVIVVGIGLVTVLALTVVDLLRTTLFAGVGGTTALVVAGVGILLLLLPLRG
jgi:hypothetical protein